MALRILFLTLSVLCCKINAISQQGSTGLWSDSECNSKSGATSNFGEKDPIALNFTLLPDVCGVPGSTVHSYRVLQNATCANGTTAMFNYYNSNNCTADPTDEDPYPPGLAKRIKNRSYVESILDGECLALIAFNSLAFICEGVAPQNVKAVSLSTSTVAPTTATSSTTPSVSFVFISISAIVPKNASSSTTPSVSSMFISKTSSNHSATTTRSSATSLSATSLSTTSPSTGSPSATSPSATTSSAASNHGSKSGLSANASAGVGLGSAIGVLAIAALWFS